MRLFWASCKVSVEDIFVHKVHACKPGRMESQMSRAPSPRRLDRLICSADFVMQLIYDCRIHLSIFSRLVQGKNRCPV